MAASRVRSFGLAISALMAAPSAARIFAGRRRGRCAAPILTQGWDVAKHQRASGGRRFEDREAKRLVPGRRCKNCRAGQTARPFPLGQAAEQFTLAKLAAPPSGCSISPAISTGQASRAAVASRTARFFAASHTLPAASTTGRLSSAKRRGLDPVRDYCGSARQRRVMAFEIVKNRGASARRCGWPRQAQQ